MIEPDCLGYSPYSVLPVSGRSVPALCDYIGSVDSGDSMTLQTRHNGIPVDIRKFSLWQRKNLFAKMCDGKQQFFSEKSARAAMNNILDWGLEGDKNLTVYICPFCGWWHFGHRPWDVEKIVEVDK